MSFLKPITLDAPRLLITHLKQAIAASERGRAVVEIDGFTYHITRYMGHDWRIVQDGSYFGTLHLPEGDAA